MKFLPLRHGRVLLTALSVASVLALLVATLWPFNPNQRNDVSWLNGEDGIRFGDYGTIFSAAEFPRQPGGQHESFSLEFWMEPGLAWDSNVMVAFYLPENPEQFIVRQDESDISVIHAVPEKGSVRPLIAGEVVEQGRKTLVTVVAGPDGTTLYVNGKAKRTSRTLGLGWQNLTGELVVGNSPMGNNSWSGILRGLAIYKRELSGQEVTSHYAAWSSNQEDTVLDKQAMLALYRFRERSGSVVKNEIQPGIDLYIPRYYRIWRHTFLTAAWREFQPTRVYVQDVVENVVGFIPLGLVLFPYFLIVRRSKRPWLMSYATGAALSLAIEVLQAFLPTRYSGWTDVITNSAGAALGASLYLFGAGRRVLGKVFGEDEIRQTN